MMKIAMKNIGDIRVKDINKKIIIKGFLKNILKVEDHKAMLIVSEYPLIFEKEAKLKNREIKVFTNLENYHQIKQKKDQTIEITGIVTTIPNFEGETLDNVREFAIMAEKIGFDKDI